MAVFDQVIQYFSAASFQPEDGLFWAENRSELNGRLLAWSRKFEKGGAAQQRAAVLVAVLGELGNNSFDHNLGQWADLPGCLIGIEFLKDRFRIAVADRGQGIARSLGRVRPDIKDPFALLRMAFEETISGRSPEKRGNGLKFVRKIFLSHGGLSLICISSRARYVLGMDKEILNPLSSLQGDVGTLTVIDWSRP